MSNFFKEFLGLLEALHLFLHFLNKLKVPEEVPEWFKWFIKTLQNIGTFKLKFLQISLLVYKLTTQNVWT